MEKLNLQDILIRNQDLKKIKKVGYVSIIGRPNVGKSTFINMLIGEKISISSNIPQTTRKKVLAIYNDDDSQIIFIDTPGIHQSNKLFNTKINNVAIKSLDESDLILYFIDSSRDYGDEEKYIRDILSNVKTTIINVYTKSDLNSKINTEENKDNIKISSISKLGFDKLLNTIKTYLSDGVCLFPDDMYTKQDIFFRLSEIIREKVFLNTKEEIPHSIYIEIEELEEKDNLLKIVSYIYCETDSQKYILIGKNGYLINKIGTEARLEIEKIFDKKVFLALRIKVKKNWRKDERLIKQIVE